MSFKTYYESEWKIKLDREEYKTLDRRWRSRWEFAKQHITPESSVLDVACGDGVMGELLIKEKQCDVYGIDLCDYAIDLAKKRGVHAVYCDMSDDIYPFEDGTFDYATLLCSLEHIIDPVHAIKETLRVLKPHGKMIITLPNAVNYKNRIEFMLGRVPIDLLHIKPGEGMHIQFFNYTNEFEQRVLSEVDGLKVTYKVGDLKNPKSHSSIGRRVYGVLIKLFPNIFSEYVHWIIEKV